MGIDLNVILPLAVKKIEERMEYAEAHPYLLPPTGGRRGNSGYVIPAEGFFEENEDITVSFHIWETKYGRREYPSPEKMDILHYHEFYEINYVYRGEVENHLQDRVIRQKPGQILFMTPLACHRSDIVTEDTILFNILFKKGNAVHKDDPETNRKDDLLTLRSEIGLHTDYFRPYYLLENTPELEFLLQSMVKEYYEHKPYAEYVLYSKLVEIYVHLARYTSESVEKDVKKLNERVPDTISEILNYIYIHSANISLAETAQAFHYSPGYFSGYIQKYTGKTFNDIVRKYKMENASRYLIHSSLTMEEIAEKIGYNDASYFRKIFAKEYGQSPRQYRKAHQMYKQG